LKKPEAFNSNIPGYARGNCPQMIPNPRGVEEIINLNKITFKHLCKFITVLNCGNMSTYTQSLNQMVFGSKGHIPFLNNINHEILFGYIAGILKKKSCHSYIVGGANNHVHIISHLHPSIAPAYLIKDIKAACHAMMVRENSFKNFPGWQVGYSLFTYHISSKEQLINYVKNQAEHHRKISFKDEIISLLEEHQIQYKEDYLFD
jgi:REP element-mobilizing transposase RayT